MLYIFFLVRKMAIFRAKHFHVGYYTPLSQPQSHFIATRLWRWNRQSVPKRWHLNYRRQGITQKEANDIKNSSWHRRKFILFLLVFWRTKHQNPKGWKDRRPAYPSSTAGQNCLYMGLVSYYRTRPRRSPVVTCQKTWTFGVFYSKLRSHIYTKALFYALIVSLKKWA
jgi:hypothetical protein